VRKRSDRSSPTLWRPRPISDVTPAALEIRLPGDAGAGLDQDEEFCELVAEDGSVRRIRFHDYAEIYRVPGLYEQLFAEALACDSPRVVCDLLSDQLGARDVDPDGLSVLDLGAGNGMVGEQLQRLGAGAITGVDLLPEAKEAAERDRPGVYADYHALDLTRQDERVEQALGDTSFNAMTCVAALGFGDIPTTAFTAALDRLDEDAWVAFNLRERFTEERDASGFATLLDRLVDEEVLTPIATERYTHRRSVSGEALPYVAIVAEKRGDVPGELL
jgi:predicted TPR repeat methyltransferase